MIKPKILEQAQPETRASQRLFSFSKRDSQSAPSSGVTIIVQGASTDEPDRTMMVARRPFSACRSWPHPAWMSS